MKRRNFSSLAPGNSYARDGVHLNSFGQENTIVVLGEQS